MRKEYNAKLVRNTSIPTQNFFFALGTLEVVGAVALRKSSDLRLLIASMIMPTTMMMVQMIPFTPIGIFKADEDIVTAHRFSLVYSLQFECQRSNNF